MTANGDPPWRAAGAVGIAILIIGGAVLLLGGIILLPSDEAPSPSSHTAVPVPFAAVIQSPRDGEGISAQTIEVRGTFAGILPPGYEIWVVVSPAGSDRFYPLNQSVALTPDGDWLAPSVVLGTPDDVGLDFMILAVVATKAAADTFGCSSFRVSRS